MIFSTIGRSLLILVALLLGCQKSAPTPSEEDVARRLPEFYFQVLPITGLYLNHDTDGIIFRYSVAEDEQRVWLRHIKDAARANGWKITHESESSSASTLYLQRIDDSKHRYRDQHSLEIVRIISCAGVLLVAGMQADIEEQNELVEFSADGPPWYQKKFWPLHVKHQTETCKPRDLERRG